MLSQTDHGLESSCGLAGNTCCGSCATLSVPPSSTGTRGMSEWRTSAIRGR